MPLTFAPVGKSVKVSKITGKDEVRQHLTDIGFNVGSEIYVIQSHSGNMIVGVKESRIALDKTVANRIIVA